MNTPKCIAYCLNEECAYNREGPTIFGTCTHPMHQNLQPYDNVKHLLLETCPLQNPPHRMGYIPRERFLTAMPTHYIIPAKGAPGPSPYKIARQMLTEKNYRPISEESGILTANFHWENIHCEDDSAESE